MTTTPDPRPRVVHRDGTIEVTGTRCTSCRHPSLWSPPRCPNCGGTLLPASFGPTGTVWSSTVVRVPVPGRTPPYALAYVDLHDGPRVLVHVEVAASADPAGPSDAIVSRLKPGTAVVVRGSTADGDVLVGLP